MVFGCVTGSRVRDPSFPLRPRSPKIPYRVPTFKCKPGENSHCIFQACHKKARIAALPRSPKSKETAFDSFRLQQTIKEPKKPPCQIVHMHPPLVFLIRLVYRFRHR